jgi:taurine dioxygenase
MGSTTTTAARGGTIEVVPTGAALGAEARGVDLRGVDAAGFAAIHEAWLDIRCCCSAASRSPTTT